MSKNKTTLELFAIALYEQGFLTNNAVEIDKLLDTHKALERKEHKNLIVGTYMDIKMKNHGLPYGFAYFNKLAKVEKAAKKFYKKLHGGNK